MRGLDSVCREHHRLTLLIPSHSGPARGGIFVYGSCHNVWKNGQRQHAMQNTTEPKKIVNGMQRQPVSEKTNIILSAGDVPENSDPIGVEGKKWRAPQRGAGVEPYMHDLKCRARTCLLSTSTALRSISTHSQFEPGV